MSLEGTSVHSDKNLFLLGTLERKIPLHKFIIGEDLNAYTNEKSDFIQFDSPDYIFDDFDYIEDEPVPDHKNLDTREINAYGRSLPYLCKSTGLCIVNGLIGKAANIGNYTCITHNSSSVIDYVLADSDVFIHITDFEIRDRI